MSAPFYNLIKGTTSGAPGTGAFTPNAAAAGFLAWSTVPAGWMGLVHYQDGSTWELTDSYWNGTTLSRAATQLEASSSGSAISLTSAATAALINDANKVQPSLGMRCGSLQGTFGSSALQNVGLGSFNARGTAAATSIASTNLLTEQAAVQYTSGTAANDAAGIDPGDNQAIYGTGAGRGGFDFSVRFGCTQLPTGPRVFIGLGGSVPGTATVDPGTYAQHFAVLGKDAADTNLQFITNDGGATAGKTDTGIALVANGWYEFSEWVQPGGGKVYFRLFRLDTGAICRGERTTDLPANNTALKYSVNVGLSSTTGTAAILRIGSVLLRTGGI